MGDSKSTYHPQRRKFFIWRGMDASGRSSPVYYDSILRATEFLMDHQKATRSETLVKTETHDFDEVFQKLKERK